jgi:hypothetical protein
MKNMANKDKIFTAITMLLAVAMMGFAGYQYGSSLCEPTNHFDEEYQQQLDSLRLLYGETQAVIKMKDRAIDSLYRLNDEAMNVLEYQTIALEKAEANRIKLKKENETLLDQTIRHINADPSFVDSLRRKHFGG